MNVWSPSLTRVGDAAESVASALLQLENAAPRLLQLLAQSEDQDSLAFCLDKALDTTQLPPEASLDDVRDTIAQARHALTMWIASLHEVQTCDGQSRLEGITELESCMSRGFLDVQTHYCISPAGLLLDEHWLCLMTHIQLAGFQQLMATFMALLMRQNPLLTPVGITCRSTVRMDSLFEPQQ